MTAKVVVFGGSGFIGSHLLKHLSMQPNTEILSVDIKEPKTRLDNVEYAIADVRDLSEFCSGREFDLVYNFAAIHTTPGHETHEYYETNIKGATQVTAFADRCKAKMIVFTSSISVYGPSEEPKTESSPPKPESSYGWSKLLAEGIHKAWLDRESDRRLVVVRPAVIFGHGEGGNFTRLAKLFKKGIFIYPGRKDTIKACFYVDDLLEAIFYAEQLKERYVLFNGCYADRYTLEEIVDSFTGSYFPNTRKFLIPQKIVYLAAAILRPFSVLGLGIHPDRITKLVRSTDIIPEWLVQQNQAQKGLIKSALQRWHDTSDGAFE